MSSLIIIFTPGKRENDYGPQGADPPPPSPTPGKAGRNHLNEEIISPLA
jgi:hypothetical protein